MILSSQLENAIRITTRVVDPINAAHTEGGEAAYSGRYANPYRSGERHDAFKRGFYEASPVADLH